MNRVLFKRKTPIMKLVFGACFFILGFFSLLGGSLYGLIICGLSVFFLHSDGSEVDLDSKRYRTFVSLFGLRHGKWKDLPEIEYVSIFSTTETTTVRALSAETNVTSDIIQLNLFYDRNKKITAYSTTDKEDAFKVARHISELLIVDILDATESESKWL